MGCTSSTEYKTDTFSGQETKKKRLGGAYPGQRRPQHQPHAPPEGAYSGGNNTATQHFVAYGGGNALTLARPDGSALTPASGRPQKEYIQVTLPDGVKPGDTIHVKNPAGKTNAIVIPSGFGPGSTFTVEFANDDEVPASTSNSSNNNNKPGQQNNDVYVPSYSNSNYERSGNNNNYNNNTGGASASQPPPPDNGPDDGFATGFRNPNWRPPTTTATAVNQDEPEVHVVQPDNNNNNSGNYSSYPSATATPVYSTY